MKHLFKNFLEDKKIYRLNERYYQSMFNKVLAEEVQPFYQTIYRNGERFLDGNPIFSTAYHDRIIRIIQRSPSSKPAWRVWLDQFDNLDELVISLELTDQSSPLVRQFVQKWLVERLPKNEMQALISLLSVQKPIISKMTSVSHSESLVKKSAARQTAILNKQNEAQKTDKSVGNYDNLLKNRYKLGDKRTDVASNKEEFHPKDRSRTTKISHHQTKLDKLALGSKSNEQETLVNKNKDDKHIKREKQSKK